MSYDYDRQTKTNPGFTRVEVIQALEDFVAYDTSWTVLQAIPDTPVQGHTPPATDYAVFHKTNGNAAEDVVIHLWDNFHLEENFGLNTSTGPFNNTLRWWEQPGARFGTDTDSHTQTTSANGNYVEYHFFGYPEYVYVVVKTDSGIWRSFAFGHIEKLSAITGGGFACASSHVTSTAASDQANSDQHNIFFESVYSNSSTYYNYLSQIRVDTLDSDLRYILGGCTDAVGPNATRTQELGPNDTYSTCGGIYNGDTDTDTLQFEYDKMRRAPSDFSITAPLIPVYIYMGRGNKYVSLVGRLPHVFAMNIKNIAEATDITIQGETYTVFPFARKTTSINPGDNKPNSYYYGFALLNKVEA